MNRALLFLLNAIVSDEVLALLVFAVVVLFVVALYCYITSMWRIA